MQTEDEFKTFSNKDREFSTPKSQKKNFWKINFGKKVKSRGVSEVKVYTEQRSQ